MSAAVMARLADVGRLGLGVPLLVVALLAMVIVPLPPFAARRLLHVQHHAVARDHAGRDLREAAARFRGVPDLLLGVTLSGWR